MVGQPVKGRGGVVDKVAQQILIVEPAAILISFVEKVRHVVNHPVL